MDATDIKRIETAVNETILETAQDVQSVTESLQKAVHFTLAVVNFILAFQEGRSRALQPTEEDRLIWKAYEKYRKDRYQIS